MQQKSPFKLLASKFRASVSSDIKDGVLHPPLQQDGTAPVSQSAFWRVLALLTAPIVLISGKMRGRFWYAIAAAAVVAVLADYAWNSLSLAGLFLRLGVIAGFLVVRAMWKNGFSMARP